MCLVERYNVNNMNCYALSLVSFRFMDFRKKMYELIIKLTGVQAGASASKKTQYLEEI